MALLAGCHIALGAQHTLLGTSTEQVAGFALLIGSIILQGGVTEFYTPLVTSLLLGIVVARIITKLAGLAPNGLTYSKHLSVGVMLYICG
ncbi:MAG: DUF2905 family protein [Tidjanibacter sp.]|nr:DUF2905 family protein [Tidjanibacter sp.]